MSTYLYLYIHSNFLLATRTQIPVFPEKIRFIKRVTKNKQRKCGGGKLPRYLDVPPNTCVMMYMNLERGREEAYRYLLPRLHVR